MNRRIPWAVLSPVFGGLALLFGCAELAGLEDRERIPDAAPDAAAESPPSAPEECNLLDDDGDGAIDEGVPWRLGEIKQVSTGTRVEALRAARMADGRVALAWVDAVQEGSRAVRTVTLDAVGARMDGPHDVATGGVQLGFGIAVCPLDPEVGVAVGEADDPSGDGRIRIERFSSQDLKPIGTRVVNDLDWEEPVVVPEALLDLTCTSAGYAYLAIDATHQPWLLWLDQVFHNGKGVLTGARGTAGTLSSGLLVGWAVSGVGENGLETVSCGMVSPGGYRQVLKATEIALVGGGVGVFLEPHSRAVAWQGDALAVAASRGGVTSVYPILTLERNDGVQAATLGLQFDAQASSVVGFRGSLVTTTVTNAGVTNLFRVDSKLHAVDKQPLVVPGASAHTLVGEGKAPVVIWASDDRTRILAAPLECE